MLYRILYLLQSGDHGSLIDKWANVSARLEPGSGAKLGYRCTESIGELFVNRLLYVDTIRRDAGLACIAKLCNHRLPHSNVEVTVIEDQNRSKSAKFEAERFDRLRRALD